MGARIDSLLLRKLIFCFAARNLGCRTNSRTSAFNTGARISICVTVRELIFCFAARNLGCHTNSRTSAFNTGARIAIFVAARIRALAYFTLVREFVISFARIRRPPQIVLCTNSQW